MQRKVLFRSSRYSLGARGGVYGTPLFLCLKVMSLGPFILFERSDSKQKVVFYNESSFSTFVISVFALRKLTIQFIFHVTLSVDSYLL